MSVPIVDFETIIHVFDVDPFLQFLTENYKIDEIQIVKNNKESIKIKYNGKSHHALIDIIKYSAAAWNHVRIKPVVTIIATVKYFDPAANDDKSFVEYHQVTEIDNLRPLASAITDRNKSRFANYEDNTYLCIAFEKLEFFEFQQVRKYITAIDRVVTALELTQQNFDQVVEEHLNQLLPKSFHSFVKETVSALCKDEPGNKLSLKTKFHFMIKAAKELKISIQKMNKE